MRVGLLLMAILLTVLLLSCSEQRKEAATWYPLAEGRSWIYNEHQSGPEGSWEAKQSVVARRTGEVTTLFGDSYPESWELTVSSNGFPISRQLMVVDGDTVKMLSIATLHSHRQIHFDPWFPEWVPPGELPFQHTYTTLVQDSTGQPQGKPFPTTVTIALATGDSLPAPVTGNRMVLLYSYPATRNQTWFYFAADTGKVREESPMLDIQARRFQSSFILDQFIP
ncbi:MAG: hypothetical protein ISR91_07205 [Candidatus Delongbacteria bacterium]|nr:hypothetical protein [Candidatus Delongbacteria bacterium]